MHLIYIKNQIELILNTVFYFLFFLIISTQIACNTKSNTISVSKYNDKNSNVDYDFDTPSNTFTLDKRLVEISGLCFDYKNQRLITHNDEDGIFFFLNPNNGTIQKTIKFSTPEDYEGITLWNENIITITSSGELKIYNIKTEITEIIRLPFSKQNNTEGLCTTTDQSKLLIATKGKNLNLELGTKSIYAFDLTNRSLDTSAFLNIKIKTLKEWQTSHTKTTHRLDQLQNLKALDIFAPSGIEINPLNQDIYISSAKGSTVVVYDKNKNLKNIIFLDQNSNPQPEGICFDEGGNLYISTEGKTHFGKIFKYIKKK